MRRWISIWLVLVLISTFGWWADAAQAPTVEEMPIIEGDGSWDIARADGFEYYLNDQGAVLLGLDYDVHQEFQGELTIPSVVGGHKVVEIDTGIFFDTEISAFSVADDHPSFSTSDGVLFNKNKSKLILYPPAKADSSYTVPQTVSEIGDSAFYSCENLAGINLGEHIEAIGTRAFGFSGLTSVTLPGSIHRLGEGWFEFCENLVEVNLPDTVTSMEGSVFYGCTALTKIRLPQNLTAIGEYAFDSCRSLQSITIPATVTSIGYSAFYGCTALTDLFIPATVTFIDGYAFTDTNLQVDPANAYYTAVDGILFNKTMTTLMSYPSGKAGSTYTVPATVTTIGEGAFSNNQHLATVVLPDGLLEIEDSAFYHAEGLQTIDLPPELTTIPYMCFYKCTALTEIILPAKIVTIHSSAFVSCESLVRVSLPEGLQLMEECAFENCVALKSLAIPAATQLEENAVGIIWGFDPNQVLPDFVLYGVANSPAQTYAQTMGITFEVKTAEEIRQLNLFDTKPVAVPDVPNDEQPVAPTFWEQYGVYIAIGGGVLLLMMGAIVVMILIKKKKPSIKESMGDQPTVMSEEPPQPTDSDEAVDQ